MMLCEMLFMMCFELIHIKIVNLLFNEVFDKNEVASGCTKIIVERTHDGTREELKMRKN